MIRPFSLAAVAISGALIGTVIAIGRMPEAQAAAVLQLITAWLSLHWLRLLPWLLAGLFFLLWRQAAAHAQLWREGADYWAEELSRAQQSKPRPSRRSR